MSDVIEPLKTKAVHVFEIIISSCENIRKVLLEQIAGFIKKCVVPGLLMPDSEIQQWIATEKDYEYDNNTL